MLTNLLGKNMNEDNFIYRNQFIKFTKDEIINQSFEFHLQGNIIEAEKYYKYCIDQNYNDHRVFSNYGIILKGLGKLKEAEVYIRKAIKIKPD